MFIGHYGLALASKKTNAGINLGTAIFATQLMDLVWPVLTLSGVEKFSIEPGNTKITPLNFEHYPYSHSLLGSMILAVGFALIYFIFKKNGKAAIICALLVFSHWILDFITHRRDLPLTFTSSKKLGLGLWNYPSAAIFSESLIYLAGIYMYTKKTKAINRKGTILVWMFGTLLAVFYIMNLVSPPPPSPAIVSYSALSLWLFVFFGYWIDNNRKAVV